MTSEALDRGPLTGLRALEFGQHDSDRHAVMRLGDARGGIVAGSLDAEANDLPRRRQPSHDRQQSIKEKLAVAVRGLFDQCLVFIECVIGQVWNP